MLEVYHFINPLSEDCLTTERRVQQVVETLHRDVMMRFVPVLSLQAVSAVLAERQTGHVDLAVRNHATQVMYDLSLDFKAMQFQGNRLARAFLMNMQANLLEHGKPYSADLALAVVRQVGGEEAAFLEDRQGESVKQALQADQSFAQEFDVHDRPTMVVYDAEHGQSAVMVTDFGVESLRHVLVDHSPTPLRSYDGWLHNGGYTEIEEG
jgi:predicted DsbA family dithiol-disulfide isomerase